MIETKTLKHIHTTSDIYVDKEQIYTFYNSAIYKSTLESSTQEILEFTNNIQNHSLKSNVLACVNSNFLNVYHLKKDTRLVNMSLGNIKPINSIALSEFSMNTILGTDDGKINIINNISAESILKFTLFSSGESIDFVDFIEENIIMGSTKKSILLVDILEKGMLAKIVSKGAISNIITCKKNIIYTTQENDIYLVKIEDFSNIETTKLYSTDSIIKDIKYDFTNSSVYVLLKNQIINIDFNSNVKELEVTFDDANCISVINKESLIIGSETSSLILNKIIDINKSDNKEDVKSDVIRFMTVDDSATIRLVIKKSILNNFKNVEVIEAEDGISAMEYLKNHSNIDVMLLDWNMPNMNGDEVVEAVSKISNLSKMKIIMATTEGGKDRVKEMLSKGVKGYLVKPFRQNSVIPLIEKMIDIVKKERE